MRKCAVCGEFVPFGNKCVTITRGKWYRRKRKHFHIHCFLDNRVKSTEAMRELWHTT